MRPEALCRYHFRKKSDPDENVCCGFTTSNFKARVYELSIKKQIISNTIFSFSLSKRFYNNNNLCKTKHDIYTMHKVHRENNFLDTYMSGHVHHRLSFM